MTTNGPQQPECARAREHFEEELVHYSEQLRLTDTVGRMLALDARIAAEQEFDRTMGTGRP